MQIDALRDALQQPPRPGQWRHAEVVAELDRLEALADQIAGGSKFERQRLGVSAEGRSVDLVRIGRGATRVLAWTQMHGDEPTHTSAVLALIELLIRHGDRAELSPILAKCAIAFVPLLNPDGAERYSRYTAVGVDLNRDARRTATPEGRMLKLAVERVRPEFGFNLHNQNHRKHPRDDPRPTRMAVLAPPVDAQESEPANLSLAKRLAGGVAAAAAPLCEMRLTKYGADYTPTAFGEWFQASGVVTVLLESGGIDHGESPTAEELQLFALAKGLELIADPSGLPADSGPYDGLNRVAEDPLFDLLLRGVWLAPPGEQPLARVDLGIDYPQRSAAQPDAASGCVADLGDLRDRHGVEEFDYTATPRVVAAPALEGSPGDTVAQWEASARRVIEQGRGPVRRGAAADLYIAQLAPDGAFDRLLAVFFGGTLAWRDEAAAR